jgi:hypothetical protein
VAEARLVRCSGTISGPVACLYGRGVFAEPVIRRFRLFLMALAVTAV